MATTPDKKTSGLPQLESISDGVRFPAYKDGTKSVTAAKLAAYAKSKVINEFDLLPNKYISPGLLPTLSIHIQSQIIDEVITEVPEYPIASFVPNSKVIYSERLHRLLLLAHDGQYYGVWNDAPSYGIFDIAINQNTGLQEYAGVIPFAHRLYTTFDSVTGYTSFFRWNGNDFEELLPTVPDTKAFDDLFNALCHPYGLYETDDDYIGKIIYQDGQKIYRLNGLDLNYQEAINVVADTMRRSCNDVHGRSYTGRTNIVPDVRPDGSSLFGKGSFSGDSLEVIRLTYLSDGFSEAYFRDDNIIANCDNLHTIIGHIYVLGSSIEPIVNCPNLENVQIDIDRKIEEFYLDSAALSPESINYLIQNRPTNSSKLTLYLSSEVYERITYPPTPQWGSLLSLAQDKGISFAEY